jgi:hypothetical protein
MILFQSVVSDFRCPVSTTYALSVVGLSGTKTGLGMYRDSQIQPVRLLVEFWADGQLGQPFHAQHIRPSAREAGRDEGTIVFDPYTREVPSA